MPQLNWPVGMGATYLLHVPQGSILLPVLRGQSHSWRLKRERKDMIITHYDDVIMSSLASQITSLTVVYSTVYSRGDQRKHQSSASLTFTWGIHRGPVNSPHKGPVTRKLFPFDDVIMLIQIMARRMFDTKPWPEPTIAYCWLKHWEQISMKSVSKYNNFLSKNGGH